MLEKHAEDWKNKVRIVAVSLDDNKQDVVDRVTEKGWTRIQHLTFGGWNKEHALMKRFEV